MRRFLLICCIAMSIAALLPAASVAADVSSPSIAVPVDTAVFGDPGTVHELASATVDPLLQGSTCTVMAIASNNESVHPGSDLVVSSGASSVRVADVEAAPNKVTEGDGTLVLGPQLTVSVILGGDGVFSGGVQLTVTCEAPPPTTGPPTTEPPTTTGPPTTKPPTTQPPTSTVPDGPGASVTVVEVPIVAVPATPVPAQPATTG
jgi:hypothetical protein